MLTDLTLAEQAALLRTGQCSSHDLVDAHLARIAALDAKLHSFVEVYADEARTLAQAADKARAAGLPLGPLHGLPIAVKDLCDIAGRVGTAGSRLWVERVAQSTSATVERLLGAGMIPLGKTHMVEFAFGAWGTNRTMGTPWNPWDLHRHRVPGGSSSGTAVAVAAGLAPIGIGSDTGGSVRIPAAFNGLVGLKVSYGRISLHGTALLSWSLDTIGPIGRSVDDCAEVLRVLAGPDARDPATLEAPALNLPATLDAARVRGARIAMPSADQLPAFMHPAVVAAWQDAAARLERLGAHVIEVRLPPWHFELASDATAIIASEAYALHREEIEDVAQPIGDVFRERAQAATRLEIGAYAQALRLMGARRRVFSGWFRDFEALLLPTVAIPAAPVDEIDEHGTLPAFLTRPANYLGLCALSMPAGLHEGLPMGVQVIGKPFAERTILEIGKAYQEDTGFHRLRPQDGALCT
jgi:aspartyl-tRNA(Asn)/glutamyl-tRNA(Gln) amidotransferase subunit A